MTASVQICVPEWIIWGRREPEFACPTTSGSTESAFKHSKSHFHDSIGKNLKQIRGKTVEMMNILLQNIHY